MNGNAGQGASIDELPELAALTPKQAAFCREYVVDSNGTQAAIRAGYSRGGASSQASGLLRNPKVAAALEAVQGKLRAGHSYAMDQLVEKYQRMAFVDPTSFLVRDDATQRLRYLAPDELSPDQRALVSRVRCHVDKKTGLERFSYEFHNQKDAMDSLARVFGMFRDRTVHEIDGLDELFEFVAASAVTSNTIQRLRQRNATRQLQDDAAGVTIDSKPAGDGDPDA